MSQPDTPHPTVGLLLSGGLDSAILLGEMLRQREIVQPFYVRAGMHWERAELAALHAFLAALQCPSLRLLVPFDLPLSDVYDGHWSLGGSAPGADTPDEAMYLPGRNALLLVKAVIYCQLHGIGRLALAPLGTSPFGDAKEEFFREFAAALNRGAPREVTIEVPFARRIKHEVMQLGRDLPLELTFSCVAPAGLLHCGRCNKCAERKAAFHDAEMVDRTPYAA